MGWYDYFSDLATSLTIQPTYAEEDARQFEGPLDKSGEQNSGKDASSGGIGTAQQDRGATTKGGVSLSTPASGTDEESGSEEEANKADAEKQKGKGGEAAKGHTPGDGGDASGQVGPGSAGPHGGSVKSGAADGGEEGENEEEGADEGEEEEEEEEEEPEDPKQKLEEECMRSQQCAPLKHHYDECAERVQHQQETKGKADEDCVEEFFHLMHCAGQCAAPKLFRQLR